jgi:trimeric autotransporter adhesin
MGKLVAYSGFSASNYLEQPYNSGLDFGTGDFCVMGWVNEAPNAGTELIFSRAYYNGGYSGSYIQAYFNSNGTITCRISDDGGSTKDTITSTPVYDNSVWALLLIVRRGSLLEMWVDDILVGTTTITNASGSLSNASASLTFGVFPDSLSPLTNGSLALWRISATAPTAEQIAKIYNDEKVLFQEGAQATLYGASDAVTALAHDDATNLLHVGTSAGRSVFQGLRRVSNTTTAVGTAISAANNLIVEE